MYICIYIYIYIYIDMFISPLIGKYGAITTIESRCSWLKFESNRVLTDGDDDNDDIY
jgi:hypothetical protein